MIVLSTLPQTRISQQPQEGEKKKSTIAARQMQELKTTSEVFFLNGTQLLKTKEYYYTHPLVIGDRLDFHGLEYLTPMSEEEKKKSCVFFFL